MRCAHCSRNNGADQTGRVGLSGSGAWIQASYRAEPESGRGTREIFSVFVDDGAAHGSAGRDQSRTRSRSTTVELEGMVALYSARRYDELIERIQLAIKLEPDVGFAHGVLALTYAQRGCTSKPSMSIKSGLALTGRRRALSAIWVMLWRCLARETRLRPSLTS
jgi:hypothetical protein